MTDIPIYGLDRELAEKAASKYDVSRESEAREWIEAVIGERLPSNNFQESLKDGIVLCKLLNRLNPSANIKPNTSKMPFKQMENINAFLSGLDFFNVPAHERFQTVDLYENKNPGQVVDSFFALCRHAEKKGFQGPFIGPRLANKHNVAFSQDKLNEGKTVIGLQMGFNGGANASGVVYGARRDIGGADPGKK